jgi:hypothetical protein
MMTELDNPDANEPTDTESHDLVPYERGLPFRDVLRGSLTRFLPGSVVGLAGILAWGGWPNFLANLPGYLALVAVATVGFGIGLEGLRRWLFPDAKIDGGRSFVAGLMVGPIWFSVIVASLIPALQGPQAWAFFPLIGVILAVLMFFAWLTPTPEEKRGDVGRVDENGTLPSLPYGKS